MTLLLQAVSPAANDMLLHFKASGHFLRMKIFAGFQNPESLLLVRSTIDELSFTFTFLSLVLVNPIFMTGSVFSLLLIFLPELYSSQTDRSDQFLLVSINWVNYVRVYSTGMNVRILTLFFVTHQ